MNLRCLLASIDFDGGHKDQRTDAHQQTRCFFSLFFIQQLPIIFVVST